MSNRTIPEQNDRFDIDAVERTGFIMMDDAETDPEEEEIDDMDQDQEIEETQETDEEQNKETDSEEDEVNAE
jgi:hypothetical protein